MRVPRRVVVLVLVCLLAVPSVSFARAMAYPGTAPLVTRAVEWVRDHGGGRVVDAVETWWYTRHPPPDGPPAEPLPAPSVGPPAVGAALTALPRIRLLPGVAPLPGEGVWRAAVQRSGPGGRNPLLWTAWFRPDPAHTSVVVGVAVVPRAADVVHLAAGTREPVPGVVPVRAAAVPAAARPNLVAVLNAGFRQRDARGGWFGAGRVAVPLRPGAASLVVTRDGGARVEAWRPADLTPDVVAVRQNLAPVVVDGRPVPGLVSNAGDRWGTGRNQFQFTVRSGVGTDRAGDLVYVGGRGLTLSGLARALADAGVVTGMELDIHPGMVTFTVFPQGASRPSTGHPLLPALRQPADRYLVPDQRDFLYVTAR